jgi:hypothetical protein
MSLYGKSWRRRRAFLEGKIVLFIAQKGTAGDITAQTPCSCCHKAEEKSLDCIFPSFGAGEEESDEDEFDDEKRALNGDKVFRLASYG